MRTKLISSISHPFFDELRNTSRLRLPGVPGVTPEGEEIIFETRKLFNFSPEEQFAMGRCPDGDIMAKLTPRWTAPTTATSSS